MELLVISIIIPALITPFGIYVYSKQQMDVFQILKANYILANHDELTGLINRRSFFSKVDALLNHAKTCSQQLAAMIVDADDFKQINDTYGHRAGDEALKLIASRLTVELPSDALIARIGGEEFAILVLAEDPAAIQQMGMSLCESVSRESNIDLGANGQLTISVGICFWEHGMNLSTLLSEADAALYESKTKGKNQVTIAQDAQRFRSQPENSPNSVVRFARLVKP